MASSVMIDYTTVIPAYQATPTENQVASSAPTPKTYTRAAAVAVPIVKIPPPTDNPQDLVTRFETLMSTASSILTKSELAEIMGIGFCITPPGMEEPAMMMVAVGAVTQALTMGQIPATYDSRAAAANAMINIDPDEEEDKSDTPKKPAEESAGSKAAAITYICLSLLRLCVKEVDTFLKGVQQLKSSYHILMGAHSEYMTSFQYSRGMCSNIASLFNQCEDLRRTLAHHCAIADETFHQARNVHGPLRFLILQHMDLTGMIPYGMYIDLKMGLPLLSPGLLLTWLHDAHVSNVLALISEINTKYDTLTSGDRFWRYSRGIDPGFFLPLQQSKCYILIARMADILVRSGIVSVTQYSDPRNARCIADKTTVKAQAEIFGKEFWAAYSSLSGSSADSGPVAKTIASGSRTGGITVKRNLHPRAPPPAPVVNMPPPQSSAPGALDEMVDDDEAQ
uniref:Nucleoprotein n=1 Tax=Citrus leprosis virus N TaxID=1956177 RepID=A0A1S5VFF9_9RHAB|nr:nucleocapsid [Citrus leprosis virus N]